LREDESAVGRKPPERTPAARNEQEHRNEVRMPCELPGLAKNPSGRSPEAHVEPCAKHPCVLLHAVRLGVFLVGWVRLVFRLSRLLWGRGPMLLFKYFCIKLFVLNLWGGGPIHKF
jgi:hypothetical protein